MKMYSDYFFSFFPFLCNVFKYPYGDSTFDNSPHVFMSVVVFIVTNLLIAKYTAGYNYSYVLVNA